MSVVSVEPDFEKRSGSDTSVAGSEANTVRWLVLTDDKDDGIQTILSDPLVPQPGSTYNHGPKESSILPLSKRTIAQAAGNRMKWYLTTTYSTVTSDDPKDENNNPTSPDQARPVVNVSFRSKREIKWRGVYQGSFDRDGTQILNQNEVRFAVGNYNMITNTSFGPVLPAVELDKQIMILRQTIYEPFWKPSTQDFYNTVNDAEESIQGGEGNVFGPFPIHTLLVEGIAAEEYIYQNTLWYRRLVDYAYDPDGWYENVANIGRGTTFTDGRGNVYSPGDVIAGNVLKRNVQDANGEQTIEDVWLNAFGDPLEDQEGGVKFSNRWLVREEKNLGVFILGVQ